MQARLRAQLGDRSKYSGERRRRSVVVATIVLTITDPLRGSYPFWYYLQAALIRSCGASFACMELTIISRFQRLQTSRKYSHHSPFYSFSVLSILRSRVKQLIFNRILQLWADVKYHVPTGFGFSPKGCFFCFSPPSIYPLNRQDYNLKFITHSQMDALHLLFLW